MSLKWLNMIQEVLQPVKISDFVTYQQPGASYHNPIMIVFSYRFLTPLENFCPKKAILEIFENNQFPKNGSGV